MKIERDKWYLDSNGRRVRVVCTDRAGGSPIVGCVESGGVATYAADGRFDPDHASVFDLVAPVPELVRGYVVVLDDGTFCAPVIDLNVARRNIEAWPGARILDLSTAQEVSDEQ